MPVPDRIERLLAQSAVTGVDFVYVHPDQTTLDVHFLRDPATLDAPLVGDLTPGQVLIDSVEGDAEPPHVAVDGVAWATVDGDDVLRLTVPAPGDFARYHLTLDDPRLDPYYNGVVFRFQAACPQDVDCAPVDPACPDEPFDIDLDTTARDFWSFRRALLDYASLAYPKWEDRLEADVGVMLVEVMSALGDEMAYYQDRVAREGYLATATQRRSVRRHARLVDYTVHDGRAASTWIDVTANAAGVLPAGYDVSALSDSGRAVPFEVGTGLRDVLDGTTYAVDAARNALAPHLWDEDDTCLPAGATELFIRGHHAATLPLDDTTGDLPPGRWVLLRTDPTDAGVEARRVPVRLTRVEESSDPLLSDPVTGSDITLLGWDEPLPWALDLTTLTVRGNLVPATAGRTETVRFSIGDPVDPSDHGPAVERAGPGDAVTYRFSLPGTDVEELAWLGDDLRTAMPEVALREVTLVGNAWVGGDDWEWRRSLLGRYSSQSYDRHFTLEDGTWRRIVGYERAGAIVEHVDYASGAGFTVRFGDGVFGAIPSEGTVFEAQYRVGEGTASNVAADTVTLFDPSAAFVEAVTNPLAVTSGEAPEPLDTVRQLAPEAFRAVTYRAVRAEDYAEAAERLPWVQRAGSSFRWTGSWLSVFTTPDPVGAPTLDDDRRRELGHQLDRFRQAGREAFARAAPLRRPGRGGDRLRRPRRLPGRGPGAGPCGARRAAGDARAGRLLRCRPVHVRRPARPLAARSDGPRHPGRSCRRGRPSPPARVLRLAAVHRRHARRRRG